MGESRLQTRIAVMTLPADASLLAILAEGLAELGGCSGFLRDAATGEVLHGPPPPDDIHPDDRGPYESALAGGAYSIAYRRADGAGGWRHLVEQARLVRQDGRALRVGAVADVSERVEADAARSRYEAMVESQAEWIVRQTPEGRNTFVNEAFCRYKGMSKEQLTAPDYGHLNLVEPESLALFSRNRASLGPERPSATTEMRVRHLDGSERWQVWTDMAIGDGSGGLVEYLCVGREITAQKHAEAALRESEQRFRRFAEAHPVPLCALRRDNWRILFVNPAYLTLFGLTWEELEVADKRTQWADPELRAPYYERLGRQGRTDNCEVVLRRKDGTPFPALMSSRLMEIGGVQAVVNSVVDLSRQREAEAEIQRQRDALHQSEKLAALGSLLAGVAHELNNPLSVVVGYASMLREEARTAAAREQAGRIHAAAQRCARIVRTFLAMARQKPPSFGPVDLVKTVDAALELAAYSLRTSGVRVTTVLPAELPPVHGDADQLHQVIANLVVNAKQALQDVPGPRRLEIELAAEAAEVRLIVADNGPGIPEEALRRVFEPFFTTKPAGVGTGLGLAVCHGIVTAHGGRIEVTSREGEGARVEVALPMAVASENAAPEPPLMEGTGSGARILVVEDEAEIAQMISRTLARDGHEVDQASDGETALARIARGGIDLVISDLRMPGMDGASLLRALRLSHPALARTAMLLTGDFLSAAAVPELRGEGAAMLLEKPIDPDELRRAVRARLAAAPPR